MLNETRTRDVTLQLLGYVIIVLTAFGKAEYNIEARIDDAAEQRADRQGVIGGENQAHSADPLICAAQTARQIILVMVNVKVLGCGSHKGKYKDRLSCSKSFRYTNQR